MIEVRLFATFREGREKIVFLPSSDCKNVSDIVHILEINPEEVAILLVNGRHKEFTTSIACGDVVALFPPVGGG